MLPLSITASSLVSAAGAGKKTLLEMILNHQTGLKKTSYPDLNFSTFFGKVENVEAVELEKSCQKFDCRNNKLAKLALDTDDFRQAIMKAKKEYGSDRIGVFIGTSTSGIAETENAYKYQEENGRLVEKFNMLNTHNISSAQTYIQHSLGLDGVGLSISTACSSSAKVFASASRYLEAGLCDAAIVGGVDSLCLTTFYGFNSLQLIANELCKPYDINRNGINI
jgi:3-oxoacyl-[acyl-carrier-protein] synthase-1